MCNSVIVLVITSNFRSSHDDNDYHSRDIYYPLSCTYDSARSAMVIVWWSLSIYSHDNTFTIVTITFYYHRVTEAQVYHRVAIRPENRDCHWFLTLCPSVPKNVFGTLICPGFRKKLELFNFDSFIFSNNNWNRELKCFC
jgi:hypothetical protein